MFIDFGAIPPETNSIRIYTGPGSAPMLAAATAWHGLATELSSMAAPYLSQVSGLAAGWHGDSGQRMAAAAAPYIRWLNTSAAQAEQTAVQATAQAVAYETARAATTPPPVIAANRSLQVTLMNTNFLGQNTPAIMATETLYMEMWAQCAAAMYGYATATTQSSLLTPFTQPQQNTDPSGLARQESALVQPAGTNAVAQGAGTAATTGTPSLQQLSTYLGDVLQPTYYVAGATSSSAGFLRTIAPVTSAVSSPAISGANGMMLTPGTVASGLSKTLGGVPTSAPIAANLASATRIGGMSVPASWANVAPAAHAAATLPATNLASSIGGAPNAAGNMLGGVPLSGSGAGAGARGIGDGVVRTGPRAFVMPRPLPAG